MTTGGEKEKVCGLLEFITIGVTHHVSVSRRLDFIYDLFEKVGSRNNEEKMGTARRKPTVSSQFRVRDAMSNNRSHFLMISPVQIIYVSNLGWE